MAKYIGKFADIAALQTAVEQDSISRPFVALTEDNDKVVYGPKLDLAKVGDIAVYGVAEDQIYYIKQSNYNTTDYPTADYVPIGVVCADQKQNIATFQNEEVRVMALKWLDNTSLTSGSNSKKIFHGVQDASHHPHRISTAMAKSDINGQSYSQFYLDRKTTQPDWKTAETLTAYYSEDGGMPYAVAWRWATPGTTNGDWYIPSAGEIYDVVTDSQLREKLNESLLVCGGCIFDTARVSGIGDLFTSSAENNIYAKPIVANGSSFGGIFSSQNYSRAITFLPITELKK